MFYICCGELHGISQEPLLAEFDTCSALQRLILHAIVEIPVKVSIVPLPANGLHKLIHSFQARSKTNLRAEHNQPYTNSSTHHCECDIPRETTSYIRLGVEPNWLHVLNGREAACLPDLPDSQL
jgi:hypothetical protein